MSPTVYIPPLFTTVVHLLYDSFYLLYIPRLLTFTTLCCHPTLQTRIAPTFRDSLLYITGFRLFLLSGHAPHYHQYYTIQSNLHNDILRLRFNISQCIHPPS